MPVASRMPSAPSAARWPLAALAQPQADLRRAASVPPRPQDGGASAPVLALRPPGRSAVQAAPADQPPSPAAPRAPGPALPDAPALHEALAQRDAEHAGWLQAAAAGDAQAFEAFYDATLPYARGVARRLLRDADAEDLLVEVYFEAWRRVAQFDAARGSALTWLLARLRSRGIDALRRQAAARDVALDEDAADALADGGDDPAERLWRRQAGAQLQAALAALSPAERWVLGLAYLRECSHREIAEQTGLPLGTVKSHLARAQGKLRLALAPGAAPTP